MSKLFAFPISALRQLLKKSIMFMPMAPRKALNEYLKNPANKAAFEDKVQRLVVVIMKAKTAETEAEFEEELTSGINFKLSPPEFYLMDGFLGGQTNLILDFVKKGIPPERLLKIKAAVNASAGA